ncbi:MAG: inositol monophosphatase family protein [Rhodospirillaceae bacterium]|nr:inositol monophosphatase family protein [Rhodospirillaceae bacterium]
MKPSTYSPALRRNVEQLIKSVSKNTILPRYKSLANNEIRTKSGPGDLVTIADEEAECALAEGLTALLPGSKIVGEEAAAADPSVLDLLSNPEPVWIIDPIDGTANFVAGRDAFGVIVALVEDGITRMGWIHDPLSTRTVWAEQYQGTWISDQRMTVDTRVETNLSVLNYAHYHRAFRPMPSPLGENTYLGSAAHEYLALVENRLQVSSFSRLSPWDHAAGILIHKEAGGYTATLDGVPYTPADTEQRGILSAPSKSIWDQVRGLANEANV